MAVLNESVDYGNVIRRFLSPCPCIAGNVSFEIILTPTCILILNTCSVKLSIYPNPLLRGHKVDQESLRGGGGGKFVNNLFMLIEFILIPLSYIYALNLCVSNYCPLVLNS